MNVIVKQVRLLLRIMIGLGNDAVKNLKINFCIVFARAIPSPTGTIDANCPSPVTSGVITSEKDLHDMTIPIHHPLVFAYYHLSQKPFQGYINHCKKHHF